MPQSRIDNQCEEGGQHDFRLPDKGHSGCYKCCCCPCWVLFSCFRSNGAAVASHQGMHGGDDRPNEITCTKCGLNQSEASALAEAKLAESQGYRTSKGPNYFRTQAERTNLGLDLADPSNSESVVPPAQAYPPPSHQQHQPPHRYHHQQPRDHPQMRQRPTHY
ncbi:hypothetical protein JCM3765_007879 [Sporobolomyces pararoseus]